MSRKIICRICGFHPCECSVASLKKKLFDIERSLKTRGIAINFAGITDLDGLKISSWSIDEFAGLNFPSSMTKEEIRKQFALEDLGSIYPPPAESKTMLPVWINSQENKKARLYYAADLVSPESVTKRQIEEKLDSLINEMRQLFKKALEDFDKEKKDVR